MRRLLLLLLVLSSLARAEDPGQSYLAVLDARTGKLLGHYLMDTVVQEQVMAGNEVPHFPYTRRFIGKLEQVTYIVSYRDHDRHDKPSGGSKAMGDVRVLRKTPNGTPVAVRRAFDSPEAAFGIVSDGRFRALVPRTTYQSGGRSIGFADPGLAVAGNFLLVDSEQGIKALSLPSGRQVWQSKLHFQHSRWDWGAWYQGGALYIEARQGLVKVDPANGEVSWVCPVVGEASLVRQYDDGRVYVGYIWPRLEVNRALEQAARERFKVEQLGVHVVPYKDGYFGHTGPIQGQSSPDHAVWETVRDQWKLIFEYPASLTDIEQLDALYARHQFSPSMRRRLTTRHYDGPHPDEP
ncbi:MAG: PQQ-binding-like beta-propeller repeat protein [Vulcanimicrobiota bacterium]